MDYKNLARGVFDVQNQVRKNPQSIIPKLEEMLKFFSGNLYKKPGTIPLQTNEGPSAIHECIQALRSTQPVCELGWSDGLVKACCDHANDIGRTGNCSHTGSDGSSFSQRMERYGDWMGNIAENCEFGSCTPEEIIINLLVDDGNSSRGHRKNILNPKYKLCGIACSGHQGLDHCTVIDYASEYGPKGQGTWNNPPSAFGNETFGGKPGFSQPSAQPSSYTTNATFSSPFGVGGTVQGNFGVPLSYSTAYQPSSQPQSQPTSYSTSGPSNYSAPSSYTTGPSSYATTQQPTSYTTSGPSNYSAPSSYTTGPSSYTNTQQNPSPYTQTQSYSNGPGNYTTTTTSYSSSSNASNNWNSNAFDSFGNPGQSSFATKQFGDRDLLKDPFISEQLAKMRAQTGTSSNDLREMAKKEAPPGATGWSVNSSIEIHNGQKVTKVTTTYSFPDGTKKEVIKEFMEGAL